MLNRSVLLVVAVAVLPGISLLVRSRAHSTNVEERWRATVEHMRELERAFDERHVTRPALWGETTDERAESHYDRACALAEELDADRVRELWHATTPEERQERAALLEEAAPVLDALHRGAHARDASLAVEWALGFEAPRRRLMTSRTLIHLAQASAAHAFDAGRPLEGVNMLLDALQFAGDLAESPLLIDSMIGLALLTPDVLVEGLADDSLAALPDEARERLRDGLRQLDARLEWCPDAIEPELVATMRGLEAAFANGAEPTPEVVGLQAGQRESMQVQVIEHVQALLLLNEEIEAAFASEPGEALARLSQLLETERFEEGSITSLVFPSFRSSVYARLYSLGRFRLLTHAVSADEEPRDPWLRALLRVEESAEGTRLTLDHEAFARLELAL
ncbi:MAG: hypothetical protein GY711_25180 [bacterium]|nr:hypothetical protein [bacterium]